MNKILFIYNPLAGKGRIKKMLSDIIELFNRNMYEVVVYSTLCKKDAKRIVEDCIKSQNYDYIVCSGGDGTLNEVVNGVMTSDRKPQIGYIPSGTTNDIAYSLNIPKNMLKATQLIVDKRSTSYDIGSFNEDYFVYSAAFGLFTDTTYQTPQYIKNMIGRLAYIMEGIKSLSAWKSYHVEISYEDKVISDKFIFGMITNSKSVGGFKGIAGKDIVLNDGQFECLFIRMPHNLIEIQNIINDLGKGNLNSDRIISFQIKQINIKSEEAVPWTLDGEYGGSLHHVDIKNCKQAISIVSLLGGRSKKREGTPDQAAKSVFRN